MSLFNAFGHGGFAALTQTLENIGNIVAPIAPNDDEADPNLDEDDDEESESFDSKVQSFFSNMRDQYQQGGSLVAESDAEPSTPTSMVSVELGAGSPRQSGKSKETSPRSIDSGSFGYVSGPELEKKVQLKYREQLEDEISSFDRKYTELQSSSAKKIQLLEQECAEWKLLAEEFKGQGSIGSDDNAEELNTLYEKLGSMTQELEDKEAELAAAQETIMALNADSISSNMRELDKDGTLQAQLTEVTDELIELRDKHAASEEHIQELTEALERAEQSVLQRAEESNAKENDLLNLTHQLRDSNKAIAALEQKLADAEAALTAAPVPFSPDAAASLMVDDLQQRLREMQQRQTEVSDHLHLAEEQSAQIRAAFMSLQTENARLTEENTSLQAQLSSSTHAATQIAENVQALQRDLEDAKEQLQTAHEEVRVLGEQLAARDRAFEESERVRALQQEQASAIQVIEPTPLLSEETEKLAAQAQELRAELDRVLSQLQENDAAHSALSTEHNAVKEELAEALDELSIVNDSVEEWRLQLAAAAESQTRAEKRERDLVIELEQLRAEMTNVDQSVVVDTSTQALEKASGRLQEAQVALLNRQQQLDAKEEDLAQCRLEISSLRVQLAAAAAEQEEIQNFRSERIEELNDKVSRLSAELSDVVNGRNKAERAQEALQEQLSILESHLGDAVEESSSLQVAMKGVRSQLTVMTNERDSALASVQQLESQLAQQVTAPPVPPSAATSESPKVLISKSSSADLDAVVVGACAAGASKATTTTTEEALAASQAEFAKAVKKIKAVNKQLKDRDAEIVKLKEGSAAITAELAALRAQHSGDVATESPGAGAGNGSVSDLETLLATAQFRIQELESERTELLARLDEMSNTTSSMSVLQSELTAAQARVTQLDEALTSSEEALKSAEEVAWQAKAEASELLFAYEQEQGRVQQLTAARDALQEEALSTRRVLAQLVDQSEPAQEEEGQLPLPALIESVFKDLRARCDKEAQELHALQAQRSDAGDELQQLQSALNESCVHVLSLEDSLAVKEAEIDSLKAVVHELSSQSEGAEQEVRQQLAQKQKELDQLLADTVKERQVAEALREETQLRISMFESLVTEKTEELEVAQRQVTEMEAEMQRVLAEHGQVQSELTAAQARVIQLDEALTSSEEALKSTEEVAWQAKAEASELLFAYEQEQGRVQQLTAARDALQDQLGLLQTQLKASAEEGSNNRIAHLDEVQAQLFAMYHSLRAASDLLRFLDEGSAGSSATPSKELTTFEHLVTHCGTDLLGPLSMLALISKTQASLADQIMTHLREQSEQLRALQETEKNATAALHEGSKLLTTLLRVVKSGSTNEDAPAQTTDLALLARKISHDLNAALNETEQRLFGETSSTQQAIALQEQLEKAQTELALEKESAVREKLVLTTQIEQSETRIAALQNEVSDHAAQFEDAFRKLSLEKQQVASELQQVQAGSAQYSEQMQTFKMHIQKIETENKQLHQVIAQLRQVRKTTKGESDNAITERDELRAHCANLQADVHALQQQLRMLTETEESAAILRSELTQVTTSLATSERNLESTRRSLAQVEKECYDKSAELEVTRTDILLIRQELDRRHVEVSNLKEAIQQVESERDFYVSRAQRELAEKLKAAQAQFETERKDLEARLSQQLEGERAQRIKLEEARQDHELFHRKAELEFNQEKKKMQRTLENALAQLNNSQQQVIDRMLVANLIVSYFKRRRSVDVLKIIAKVLSFDDEQLIAVGLKVPPIDLLGSLLSTVIGRPAPAPEVKGDNLAEQWINFLIDESDQDAANSAGLVPRARSHSDAVSSPTVNAKMSADVDLTYK